MGIIRNLLALIGLIAVALVIYGVVKIMPYKDNIRSFDPEAGRVFTELAFNVLKTGNAADATVWKVPVKEGLSAQDVESSMRSIASENNIKNVGELPLYKEVAAMSGKPYRFAKIFMFCNALTAAKMMDYDDAYSAYLPCRVSLIEDSEGKLWLYSLNMDMMIYGGQPLPPELKKEAMNVKRIILDIMNRGSQGDF
jgi:uncharacterized protein (DUF302 family)